VLRTILVSQFGKYLPGNVGHHVGRVMLAKNSGLSNGSIAITMILELLIVIFAACATALLAFSLDNTILLSSLLDIPTLDEIIAFFLIATILLTYLFSHKPFILKRLYSLYNVTHIRLPYLLSCLLLYIANFLIHGGILYLLMSLFASGGGSDFWILTGVFSIAWLVGFITPGAPAGLGIREVILVSALDPIYGPGVALSLTVSSRVITTIGDGIGFLIGLVLSQWFTKTITYSEN